MTDTEPKTQTITMTREEWNAKMAQKKKERKRIMKLTLRECMRLCGTSSNFRNNTRRRLIRKKLQRKLKQKKDPSLPDYSLDELKQDFDLAAEGTALTVLRNYCDTQIFESCLMTCLKQFTSSSIRQIRSTRSANSCS